MRLLIVRHAPAGDKTAYAKTGKPDSSRPLTAEGRRKMKKGARGLKRVFPSIDLIATSPLTRAAETARILSRAYGAARIAEIAELSPGSRPEALLKKLKPSAKFRVVALVGHEPHLSSLVGFLIAKGGLPRLELKKGAACLIDFPGAPAAGAGTLLWALAPAQLREFAG